MELAYTIKQLDFSPVGEFAYPHATVLVQLLPSPTLVTPAIKLQIRITTAAAAAGLQDIAAAALAEAQQLLPRSAAEHHLRVLVAEELKLQEDQQTRDEAALMAAMDAARQPSAC